MGQLFGKKTEGNGKSDSVKTEDKVERVCKKCGQKHTKQRPLLGQSPDLTASSVSGTE